ncbi:MAG: methanogenesis marker 16 metalloprotein [Methanotrichaceae archaeon]
MARSFSDIKQKIDRGEAVVLTAQEVCDLVDSGEKIELEDVDVVTTATRAIMSGTYAVLSFPVAKPYSFCRAKRAWLNGVPAQVGPCPNERLGVLDLIIFGTTHSRSKTRYGGGHLFRDLVERKKVIVEVETDESKFFQTTITLDEMPLARLFGTRQCFKNYTAFVNLGDDPVSTIFHATEFNPKLGGATVSGCGQLNPIENDPLLETIGVGTRVLINGAQGFVIGTGTRSTLEKPNLSGFADMHQMDPEYMGGFLTSCGPECVCSWAVPIPVLNSSILDSITKMDRDISLPVVDVIDRKPIDQATYGDVWEDVDLTVKFDPGVCKKCDQCIPESVCPTKAISFESEKPKLDRTKCFNCGLCATCCEGKVFSAELGALHLDDKEVPIVLRQSDRQRALLLAQDLKKRILEKTFKITEMVERIDP